MNLHSVLEELNKLYEELPAKEATTKPCDETLTEADDEELVVVDGEEIVDDTVLGGPEDSDVAEEAQSVLECANCGALVIKTDQDIKLDNETELANADESCQYCEEANGYKIIGTFIPTANSALEEGIFDKDITPSVNLSLDGGTGKAVSVLDEPGLTEIFGLSKKEKWEKEKAKLHETGYVIVEDNGYDNRVVSAKLDANMKTLTGGDHAEIFVTKDTAEYFANKLAEENKTFKFYVKPINEAERLIGDKILINRYSVLY